MHFLSRLFNILLYHYTFIAVLLENHKNPTPIINWVNIQAPAGFNWLSICSDDTGNNITAVAENGRIYTRNLYYAIWNEAVIVDVDESRTWSSISCSLSGKFVAVVAYGGELYYSSDFGNKFRRLDVGNRSWFSVDLDSSGRYIYAAVYDGLIYKSADYGNTWNTLNINATWSCVTTDATGRYVAATSAATSLTSQQGIYLSSDYGDTWSLSVGNSGSPVNAGSWWSISMDHSGQYLVAAIYNAGLYTSSDYGVSWSLRVTTCPSVSNSITGCQWRSVVTDGSGKYMAAAAYSQGVYISTDYGISWKLFVNNGISQQHATNTMNNLVASSTILPWRSLTIDNTGTLLSAAAETNGIFTLNVTAAVSALDFIATPSATPTIQPTTVSSDSLTPTVMPTAHPAGTSTELQLTTTIAIPTIIILFFFTAILYRRCCDDGQGNGYCADTVETLEARGEGGGISGSDGILTAAAIMDMERGGDGAVYASANRVRSNSDNSNCSILAQVIILEPIADGSSSYCALNRDRIGDIDSITATSASATLITPATTTTEEDHQDNNEQQQHCSTSGATVDAVRSGSFTRILTSALTAAASSSSSGRNRTNSRTAITTTVDGNSNSSRTIPMAMAAVCDAPPPSGSNSSATSSVNVSRLNSRSNISSYIANMERIYMNNNEAKQGDGIDNSISTNGHDIELGTTASNRIIYARIVSS